MAQVSDFSEWRQRARDYLRAELAPEQVDWGILDPSQGGLFETGMPTIAGNPATPVPRVPRQFIQEAAIAAQFRADDRWAHLYRILWRLTHGEPWLLDMDSDDDVIRLRQRVRAVRRDQHKMKAFVRFRKAMPEAGNDWYLAWFEPAHLILAEMAGFFCRRFTAMCWGILTPDGALFWDGRQLYRDDRPQQPPEIEDRVEEAWATYYRNTFNPARLKLNAMRKEMPRKYWKNLPEAVLIRDLAGGSTARVESMLGAEATGPGRLRSKSATLARQQDSLRAASIPAATESNLDTMDILARCRDVADLAPLLAQCRACDAWCRATRAVPGEGATTADIMVIGEQPGDREDLAGRPFVGPAGELLQAAIAAAGLEGDRLYITNAVKHFNWQGRGKRRIHQRPSSRQIKACSPWLDAELGLLRPRAILVLGNTAGRRLLGGEFTLKARRGRWSKRGDARVFATVHPSSVLRSPGPGRAAAEAGFFADIAQFAADLER